MAKTPDMLVPDALRIRNSVTYTLEIAHYDPDMVERLKAECDSTLAAAVIDRLASDVEYNITICREEYPDRCMCYTYFITAEISVKGVE